MTRTGALMVVALLSGGPARAQELTRSAGLGEGAVVKLYAQVCAGCHGPDLAGGRAQSLLDDRWTFGGDDASLAQSIREGRPGTDMMAFKAALTDQQIRSLVIFIREQAATARTQRPKGPTLAPDAVFPSEKHAFRLETVAEGLDTPWGLAFLPDGRLLVSERPGRLRIISHRGGAAPHPPPPQLRRSESGSAASSTSGQPPHPPGKSQSELIAGIPAVWARQDGGLLDVAVHPDYARNGWVYLAYSDPGSAGASMTAIVRGRISGANWIDQETLYKAPPEQYWVDNSHFGLRFLFDSAGHLFYSIGDRGHQDDAQDLSRPNGKIHRVNDDGSIPGDNPFVGRAGAMPSIWSYGNRNPQGLARHPVTGELWSTEHGPRGGDELNLIRPGRNYGWPVVTFGMNYDGTSISAQTEREGMEAPIVQWTPSPAVCAIRFYTGGLFPGWKNDLLVTALAHQELRRLVIEGDKVVHQEVLFQGLGRVRNVTMGPDGHLYVVLNQPGRIVRVVPAPAAATH